MESNRVNFNFEYELYAVPEPVWMERVLRPSMECLYFYCDERLPLFTDIEYSEDFLEQAGGEVTVIDDQVKNWWGEISPISKLTNCKLENHRVNKELGLWTPAGGIVSNFDELLLMMSEGRWRLKDPWMMGGTGQWRVDSELIQEKGHRKGIEDRLQKGELLLERSLDIDQVLGTTFELTDNATKCLFSVENHLNSQGNFQGGQITNTPKEILDSVSAVASYWQKKGARGILEVDSFRLVDSWYPCVEVNHRKTMGWFIWNLTKKFGPGKMLLNSHEGFRVNPEEAAMSVSWLTF